MQISYGDTSGLSGQFIDNVGNFQIIALHLIIIRTLSLYECKNLIESDGDLSNLG